MIRWPQLHNEWFKVRKNNPQDPVGFVAEIIQTQQVPIALADFSE